MLTDRLRKKRVPPVLRIRPSAPAQRPWRDHADRPLSANRSRSPAAPQSTWAPLITDRDTAPSSPSPELSAPPNSASGAAAQHCGVGLPSPVPQRRKPSLRRRNRPKVNTQPNSPVSLHSRALSTPHVAFLRRNYSTAEATLGPHRSVSQPETIEASRTLPQAPRGTPRCVPTGSSRGCPGAGWVSSSTTAMLPGRHQNLEVTDRCRLFCGDSR